ncbi:MAG: amino acid synthesis family protein, partial [Nitrospinota bacterium]|nr:amino acid synthesis family protein [Nitrospinota bacterium]
MSATKIRKLAVLLEETFTEADQEVRPPVRKAAALAVIQNPFAGKYVEDLSPLFELGAEMGELLGKRAVQALGAPAEKVQSYGKAAIVGA